MVTAFAILAMFFVKDLFTFGVCRTLGNLVQAGGEFVGLLLPFLHLYYKLYALTSGDFVLRGLWPQDMLHCTIFLDAENCGAHYALTQRFRKPLYV